jgi:hypothetical protein
MWAGCTVGDTSLCRIERYAAVDLDDQTPVACGSLSLDVDGGFNDAAMRAARECVLDAVAGKLPFTLFYDDADFTRHVRGGFTGAADDNGVMRLRSYAYVGDSQGAAGDAHPVVTSQTCKSVVAASNCTPTAGRPCLTCMGPGTPSTLCRY